MGGGYVGGGCVCALCAYTLEDDSQVYTLCVCGGGCVREKSVGNRKSSSNYV